MTARMIGARIPRNEDPRLLRGLGCFVDDVHLEGTLHAAGLRSPHGHARIVSIDAARARALPGVHLVLTAADLGELNQPSPLLIPHPALTQPRTQRPLATDHVRYMGEMVAFVVAEDRYVAEDAAELIEVRYEPLPAVTELEAALADGSPRVHADVPANRAGRLVQRVGDPDAAFARAARVLRERLWIERSCGCPIETRGVLADFDARAGTLKAWISTQAPLPIKNGLARIFGLPEFQVEVIAPDIGGAFGSKIMLFYPEEILVPCAAMRLGRPVKWIEDRVEHLLSTSQERGQLHDVEVAIDDDGRILGLRDRFLHDAGAYTPYGLIVPLITSTQLPGPYRLRNYHVEFDVVYTNKVQVTPYRGAGRPHGAFVMERVIGLVARELGIEPVEVRRRNLIQPDEFPWDVGLTFQDGGPTRYDSGSYPAGLDMALSMIGYGDFRARQAAARADGRHLGLGVAGYVEGTGIGPYEGARVRVEPSGKVFVATGLTTHGQGHQTTFAQIAADALGCDPADVTVVTGDTSRFNWGAGTFASRALVTSGNAVSVAALKVRDKALHLAAHLLEASALDLEVVDGAIRVKGAPDRRLTLGALATVANPIRYAYGTESSEAALRLVKPREGPCSPPVRSRASRPMATTRRPRPRSPADSTPPSCEIDIRTGEIAIVKYVVQHDCGTMVNPTVVEGQVHGGVAQGIGGALYEKIVYDERGQLLTGTFMDFLIPTAMEVPDMEVGHIETPSPLNPSASRASARPARSRCPPSSPRPWTTRSALGRARPRDAAVARRGAGAARRRAAPADLTAGATLRRDTAIGPSPQTRRALSVVLEEGDGTYFDAPTWAPQPCSSGHGAKGSDLDAAGASTRVILVPEQDSWLARGECERRVRGSLHLRQAPIPDRRRAGRLRGVGANLRADRPGRDGPAAAGESPDRRLVGGAICARSRVRHRADRGVAQPALPGGGRRWRGHHAGMLDVARSRGVYRTLGIADVSMTSLPPRRTISVLNRWRTSTCPTSDRSTARSGA
jgi:CO/xanthine dehydrogenase Mo-binding subunit